jgi:hypothetical protein
MFSGFVSEMIVFFEAQETTNIISSILKIKSLMFFKNISFNLTFLCGKFKNKKEANSASFLLE